MGDLPPMSAPFDVEIDGHVAILWLANPDRRNAMGPDFWRELPPVVARLDGDEQVRAVVVAARGAHFSVGLDLVAMGGELGPLLQGGLAKDRRRLFDMVHAMRAGFDAIVASDKPFVCAIHGACIGGGLDLASACDVRLATADARISLREAKIAIVADMGSLQRLGRVIGAGHLRELAFTGKDVSGARAKEIALVNDTFADAASLHLGARALAAEIAANSPLTVQGVKQVLRFGERHGEEAGLRFVAAWNAAHLASGDLVEAMTAFAEKRPAQFRGE